MTPVDTPARTEAAEKAWTEAERIAFWEDAARRLEWAEPWHTAHTFTAVDPAARRGPEIRWFDGGKLNAAVNCADRHVAAGRGDKVALHFEGEPGDRRTVTYRELQELVSRRPTRCWPWASPRATASSSTCPCWWKPS